MRPRELWADYWHPTGSLSLWTLSSPTAAAGPVDPKRFHRFEHEARAASALNHHAIVTIYGIDEHEGTVFIAMELVDGMTLRQRLADSPVDTKEALRLATTIADGLARAIQADYGSLGNVPRGPTVQAHLVRRAEAGSLTKRPRRMSSGPVLPARGPLCGFCHSAPDRCNCALSNTRAR